MKKKMNPQVKRWWVRALESGKYKKGRNALNPSKGKYCCLGVLCDIYQKKTGKGKWEPVNDHMLPSFKVRGDSSSMVLPNPVAKWAGLKNNCAYIKMGKGKTEQWCEFPELNDEKKWSFKRIAAAIRRQL